LSSNSSLELPDSPVGAAAAADDKRGSLDAEIGALNEQAERCRRLPDATSNREVNAMLGDLAKGFERSAGELSTRRCA